MERNKIRLTLAENIKRFRSRQGFSQEQLAEKAGLSTNYLSAIETARKWPYPETLSNLAEALNVNVGDFFQSDNDVISKLSCISKYSTDAMAKLEILNNNLEKMILKY
ncbi:MAG: helix-turn-helix domain-containing protein [Spirochaetaceae bacterium]|jgi:transcriptional regulator with XRE-family HTH domain|nr:helix-turn-helix domain-containing protein [Spirochaetaceae bacterium]